MAFATAVGFDFDHTLGVDNRLEHDVAVDLLHRSGGAVDNERAVDGALVAFRRGLRPIDEAMADIGVDPTRFRSLVLERAPNYVKPLADTVYVLTELERRGIPIAILSNGWSPLQELKARIIGFRGPVLVSDVIGVRKPSAAAFHELERALGVARDSVAYVGDDPEVDVAGALATGMRGVWLDWEGKTYPQNVAAPTLRISSLTELLRVLPGPVSETAKPPA